MTKKNVLIVVESPSKAKKIAKFLDDSYNVIASYGHVIDLDSKELSVSIEDDFKPKYKIIDSKADKIKLILDLAKKSSLILLASDNDREGEGIAKNVESLLKKFKVPIKRIIFNEITKKAIIEAINNPKEIDENLFLAQQARRVLDRIVGFAVSPYLTDRFSSTLSAGRVQSVAVRLIVDREKEVKLFESKKYWVIEALFVLPSGEKFLAKMDQKFDLKADAEKNIRILEDGTFSIKEIIKKDKKKEPDAPFITSSLTASAAGSLNFSAEETMKLAQTLYEAGHITYMRTDSIRCSQEAIVACREWLINNNYTVPSEQNIYSSGSNSQDAHEAIRPTDIGITPYNIFVSETEQKLYKFIWERFVASQMEPAIITNTLVIIESSSGLILKAYGNVLKYKGWLELFKNNDFKSDNLPEMSKKDILKLVSIDKLPKTTKGPLRFSEKTLIQELEKRGIGRPSTYAAIISKIKERYVLKNSTYSPTKLGNDISNDLCKYFSFMNFDYTAMMEKKLDEIAAGNLKYVDMMNDFFEPFLTEQQSAYIDNFKDLNLRCVNCKLQMVSGKDKRYVKCINYPFCNFKISCDFKDEKIIIKNNTKHEVCEDVRCPNCHSAMNKIDGKFGIFFSCIEYPLCNGKRN